MIDRGKANRRRALLAGAFALTILAAACGSSSNPSASSPSGSESSPAVPASPSATASEEESGGTMTIGGDQANDHGSKDVTGASSADVEMDDFYFEPTVITGSPGQKLAIDLENSGDALHNFSLTDQSIDQDVQSGQTGSVSVTIPQSGFVEFFCKYHKALGMVGELKAS